MPFGSSARRRPADDAPLTTPADDAVMSHRRELTDDADQITRARFRLDATLEALCPGRRVARVARFPVAVDGADDGTGTTRIRPGGRSAYRGVGSASASGVRLGAARIAGCPLRTTGAACGRDRRRGGRGLAPAGVGCRRRSRRCRQPAGSSSVHRCPRAWSLRPPGRVRDRHRSRSRPGRTQLRIDAFAGDFLLSAMGRPQPGNGSPDNRLGAGACTSLVVTGCPGRPRYTRPVSWA